MEQITEEEQFPAVSKIKTIIQAVIAWEHGAETMVEFFTNYNFSSAKMSMVIGYHGKLIRVPDDAINFSGKYINFDSLRPFLTEIIKSRPGCFYDHETGSLWKNKSSS